MSATEMRGCPFCGATNVAIEDRAHLVPPIAIVVCGYCEAEGPTIEHGPLHDAESEAVRLWNTRPAEDAIVERIAAWLAQLDVSEWVDRGLHNEELLEEAARCIRDGSWKGGK